MSSIYHEGEKTVQSLAGRQFEAAQLSGMIRPTLVLAAKRFLESQSLAVAGTIDAVGRVWASLLTGKPGFLQAQSERLQYGSVNRFDRSDRPLNPPILGDFYRSCSPRIADGIALRKPQHWTGLPPSCAFHQAGGWGAYPNRIASEAPFQDRGTPTETMN